MSTSLSGSDGRGGLRPTAANSCRGNQDDGDNGDATPFINQHWTL